METPITKAGISQGVGRLLGPRTVGDDGPGTFADCEDLVGLDLPELFHFLGGGPFHFDEIDSLRFAEAEVKAEVALRHDAGAAMDFVHLHMLPGHHADASADSGAIALGAEQLDLDPVLLVAAVIAKKRRRVIHI